VPARRQDASDIAELSARLFRDRYETENTPEDIEIYLKSNFSLPVITKELSDEKITYLMLYQKYTLIGYAKLTMDKAPSELQGTKPLELARIYVEPENIGKGFGSALMSACLERAIDGGFNSIWLGVWQKNHQAINFYLKWGFTKVGTQKFLLGKDMQNDFIMEKILV
jgi:ribosomal protein S18 acetylase RimI-like enzyme